MHCFPFHPTATGLHRSVCHDNWVKQIFYLPHFNSRLFKTIWSNSRISKPWIWSNQIQGFSRLSRPRINPACNTITNHTAVNSPCVRDDTQQADAIAARYGIAGSELYDSCHRLWERFPHLVDHSTTGQLVHPDTGQVKGHMNACPYALMTSGCLANFKAHLKTNLFRHFLSCGIV